MALNGTYKFPQFNADITNPTLTVLSKKFRYADSMTIVEINLAVPGAVFGLAIESPNVQGGSQALPAITNFVESYLNTHHKVIVS
jgi:hypothetical protein